MAIELIGEKISLARKAMNMSQAELATKLNMSPQMVSKWERGESLPDIIMLKRLSEELNINICYLISDEVSEEQETNITPNANQVKIKTDKALANIYKFGNWNHTDFSNTTIKDKNFSYAQLKRCNFSDCNLEGNNFSYTEFYECDLQRANLKEANLKFIDINKTDASGVNLEGSYLKMSDFKYSKLNKAQLNNARIYCTCFKEVEMIDINLNDTLIEKTTFIGVIFNNITFNNTLFKECKFKKSEFLNCRMDKITYNFLKSCKVNLSNVELI